MTLLIGQALERQRSFINWSTPGSMAMCPPW